MRVIVRGNWAPYVGTDYCEALGIYDNLGEAMPDAEEYAWNCWEGDEDEDEDMEPEGPDFWVEEYNPEKHDRHRAGGGSFAEVFEWLESKMAGE